MADRGPGALHQDRLEVLVALAPFPGTALPGRFVVAGAHPGPGRQVRGVGEELQDVGAGLGDDRGGGQRAIPGMVVSRSRAARKGAIIASICASSLAIIASRWSMWSRCRRNIRAWCSPKRPSSALARSGILTRIRPIARSASTSGRRSPSMSDSIIDRPDLVTIEEATESILILGVLQLVTQPLHLRGAGLDDLGAVADNVPGGLDVRRGDEAAGQQPALQQLHQPLRVSKIGLAARDHRHVGHPSETSHRAASRRTRRTS